MYTPNNIETIKMPECIGVAFIGSSKEYCSTVG